jgi:mannose-6-phosphate isomerase-like protein (cupin superfamily)
VSAIFSAQELDDKADGTRPFNEFLRTPTMSAGVYVLPAGSADHQTPHKEDEIYYVISGTGRMRLGSEERAINKGSVIFVEAGVEHRFLDIAEELVLLVVFAPAET